MTTTLHTSSHGDATPSQSRCNSLCFDNCNFVARLLFQKNIQRQMFPVSDVTDIRRSKYVVKYDLSDNLLCQLCKKL